MVPYTTRGKKLKCDIGAVVKTGDVSLALRRGKSLGAELKAKKVQKLDCGPPHARTATILMLMLILPSISYHHATISPCHHATKGKLDVQECCKISFVWDAAFHLVSTFTVTFVPYPDFYGDIVWKGA